MATGTESATETSYWIKFFTDAQIPAGDATHYAVLFSDNRIQRGMLLDLNKDYLTDMGVTRLGDIIAILKHARTVHDQDAKDKALKETKFISSTASPSRRTTAASRMVDHFLASTTDSAPMNQPTPSRLSGNSSSFKKSSVFDRLGGDSPGLAGNESQAAGPGDSVFTRLGGKAGQKRAISSNSQGNSPINIDDDSIESPLQYQGILKSSSATKTPPVPRKKIRVAVEDPVKVTGLNKIKIRGFEKVKAANLDHILDSRSSSFDVSDIQPLKVQVSSTTATPKVLLKRRTKVPRSNPLYASNKKSAIQREEVTTTTPLTKTEGVLSMDAPAQTGSIKNRLGSKVHLSPATSTTSGFGPSTKNSAVSDVKSRLGAKVPQQAATKFTVSTSSKAKPSSGVFGRLGKKFAVS